MAMPHEKSTEPHIPVFEKSARGDGIFSRSDFTVDHKRDAYICPGDKELRRYWRSFATPRDRGGADGMVRYHATRSDCCTGSLSRSGRCPERIARVSVLPAFSAAGMGDTGHIDLPAWVTPGDPC
jgi:hypothetical protein